MEWLDHVLVDASRVAHYHPLRPEEPLEVLSLDLRNDGHTPVEVRGALEKLAALHTAGPNDAFQSAMTALSPWRHSYLYAKGLSRDVFPVIAIDISSTPALEAAEAFFSMDKVFESPRLALFLRVQIADKGTDDEFDTLSRIAEMLRQLRSERSRFDLKMVEMEFDTDRMRDRELEMATRALSLAVHGGDSSAPAFKISVGMVGSTEGGGGVSITGWCAFFQTLCRVGVHDDAMGNELGVSFANNADPRVVAAFWSALAFSSGYAKLTLRAGDDLSGCIQAKYVALALLSPVSQVTHLDWFNCLLNGSTVDAMTHVQAATSREELSAVLWSSEWSDREPAKTVKLSSLNVAIVTRFGWMMLDSGESEWIDVFVPGMGQCSVERDEWYELMGNSQHEPIQSQFRDCTLMRFEAVLQLSESTTHIHAARFLRLIGRSIRFIELKPWRYACSLELVLAIFESCPLLRELTVHQTQLASNLIVVDPNRLVSRSLIKLKLLFVNEPSPRPVPGAFTETFFETVIPFVGDKVEYLELRKQPGIIPFARAFAAIAQSCVSLFHLKLEHLDVDTLDPLIKAYREGNSRVSSLYLLKSPVTSSSLVRFAEFLSDRSCPGSFKLGVLHVTHFAADSVNDAVQLCGLDASSIKAILAMLDKNLSLTELYLGVTDTGVGRIVPEPLRPFRRRFDVYDEQEIPVASEKFPIESTVAFVDVLQRKCLPFDQETVGIVTTFAAQRIRRSVRYDVAN